MDLVSNNLRSKIDALMDRFYGAGVASHPTIIEQINYLLFMRALSVKDDEYRELGVTDPDKIIFDDTLAKYKWENLMNLNAEALFTAIQDCFEQIPKSTTNNTVRLVFRNAHLKLYDKPTLRVVVHELDKFAHDMDELNQTGHRDIFGDMYEYLLSKLSQAGTSGQFRTPRHIIEFIVAVVAPKKGETILDPAVGTAGFLVKAFEYLQKQYTSEEFAATGGSFDKLNAKEQSFLYEHTFNGFDSDEDMIKFGMMNLYLHGLENAQLFRQNTLTDTAGNRDKYDMILANPPFSGKIDQNSVAQELQMNTGATEVLFIRYMLEHLKEDGRIGVIVPEGIIFQSGKAYENLRTMLMDSGLWCVVSLPVGVFNPYTKTTKTSILFIDKAMQHTVNGTAFIQVENDGFDLNTTRTPIAKNDLPAAINLIRNLQAEKTTDSKEILHSILGIEDILNRPEVSLSILNDITEVESSKYENVGIGKILERKRKSLLVNSDTIYKQITVKMNGRGVVLRKELKGSEIKTKSQFIAAAGDFIMSKIDARNGAFGIVPIELEGAIVTSDFPLFKVNNSVMSPHFLNVMMQSPQFINICKTTSVGTSNRKRIKIPRFLASRIPLPSIEQQLAIITELNAHQRNIQLKKEEILDEEQSINMIISEVWGE